MWIGVISDTQGELHPEVPHLFEGMDFIIHCGAIGSPSILEQLSEISPVSGVIGDGDDAAEYPFDRVLYREMAGVPVLVSHDVGTPARPSNEIGSLLSERNPKVLLFGNTLEPFNAAIGDRLWFNPGGAGPAGASHRPSAGILEIEGQAARGEIVFLDIKRNS